MKKRTSTEKELQGLEAAVRLFGEEHVRERLHKWERLDPEFNELTLRFSYGGLYAREVLEPKIRELCTISGLTVLNALPQLKSHMRAAFRVGATEAEVKEAIFQMITYCGSPYVAQALGAYEEVERERTAKKDKVDK